MSVFTILPPELYDLAAFGCFDLGADHHPGTAHAAAWLCQLAYETADRHKVGGILDAWGARFVANGIISVGVTSPLPISRTEAILARRGKINLLAFAGTDPVVIPNLITDLRFAPNGDGVANGFAGAAASALPTIESLLAGDKVTPLCVMGHSLGGALAVVTAGLLASSGYDVISVYTFGMPRTGSPNFKERYDATLGNRTYRLVHGLDVVPTVAPSSLGLRHVGRLLHCASCTKFNAAMLSPGTDPDDPSFSATAVDAVVQGLRRPWERSLRALDALQRIFDPHVAVSRHERSDAVGLLIETFPAPLRDHLPDRYISATA